MLEMCLANSQSEDQGFGCFSSVDGTQELGFLYAIGKLWED